VLTILFLSNLPAAAPRRARATKRRKAPKRRASQARRERKDRKTTLEEKKTTLVSFVCVTIFAALTTGNARDFFRRVGGLVGGWDEVEKQSSRGQRNAKD